MAGETSKAAAHRAADRRKRLSATAPQTADNKYYKSGDVSVIKNTAADTRGRAGSQPQPVPTPNIRFGDLVQSADKKYYANSAPQAPTREQLARASGKSAAVITGGAYSIRIRTQEEVATLLDHVADRLNAGFSSAVVEVANSDLMKRARAKLDTLVTRAVISEDQGRDVQFVLYGTGAGTGAASQAPVLPPPEPRSAVSVDAESFLDPAAVLSGGLEDDEVVDVSPDTNATEVTLSSTGAVVADEDDSDDLLAPVSTDVPSVTEESAPVSQEVVETPQAEPVQDEADMIRRPGRRSGRGSR